MTKTILSKVSANQGFICVDGSVLTSVQALKQKIEHMPLDEFKHYVGKSHNYFANWVGDVFELRDLAKKLNAASTKGSTQKVLESAFKKQQVVPKKRNVSKKMPGLKKQKTMNGSTKRGTLPLHHKISHLSNTLEHMTKYDSHTPSHTADSYAEIRDEIKDKLIDFAFGLVIGLILGLLLAKSTGFFG